MHVRLFCRPDDGDLGILTKMVIDMVTIDLAMPLSLLPIPPTAVEFSSLPPLWQPYAEFFAKTVSGPYVNVVSSDHKDDWEMLWTQSVTNVLITTQASVPPKANDENQDHIIHLNGYATVIVPTSPINAYREWNDVMPVIVVPPVWNVEHSQALRDVLLT
jgi:hypothetical protein